MRIRLKTMKSLRGLIKAISTNRAHLFPVKVPIRGKKSTFYGIRYKSGKTAMEYVKKENKLPKDAELIFDSKDGKAKGLSEKDVLDTYEKAGKPGSLQEFVKKNFDKPKAKDDGQLSFSDLMKPKEEKSNKESKKVDDKEKKVGNSKKTKLSEKQIDTLIDMYSQSISFGFGSVMPADLEPLEGEETYEAERGRSRAVYGLQNEAEEIIKQIKRELRNDNIDKEKILQKLKDKAFECKEALDIIKNNKDLSFWSKFTEFMLASDRFYKDEGLKPFNDYCNTIKQSEIDALELKTRKNIEFSRFQEAIEFRYSMARAYNKKLIDAKKSNASTSQLEKLNKIGTLISTKNNASYWYKANKIGVTIDNLLAYDLSVQDKNIKDESLYRKESELPSESENPDIFAMMRRFGTKKIKSNNEYEKASNLNELVNRVKSIKDYHTDIKGRAIMDMLGVNAPLYSKRSGEAFTLGKDKAVGYCYKSTNGETIEIGLVAERGNPVAETKTAIHECMHAKLSMSVYDAVDKAKYSTTMRPVSMRHDIEETIVEMAGQGVSNLIHGSETDRELHSYAYEIADVLPRIWDAPEFKQASKKGIHGIGVEITKRLMANDTDFVKSAVQGYADTLSNGMYEKRIKAIESKIKERNDKTEKIQKDTGISALGDLVHQLKMGTISLEGALNSGKYAALAAILITKFLEDEDIEAIEQLALSF